MLRPCHPTQPRAAFRLVVCQKYLPPCLTAAELFKEQPRMPTVRALPSAIEALRYLDRARQFRRAGTKHVDIENGQPFWPKWFLITHALELAIKAYIVSREKLSLPSPTKEPANHDLVGLYEKAVLWGLTRNPLVMSGLPHLSELHQSHYARYPQDNVIPAALIAQFDDLTDQLLADVTKAVGL
jgi:hypothetical protein